jgi:hypothetical protein
MANNLAVHLCHNGDDAVASFSQGFYQVSLSRLTKGRRNDVVNSFAVERAFFPKIHHRPIGTQADAADKVAAADGAGRTGSQRRDQRRTPSFVSRGEA